MTEPALDEAVRAVRGIGALTIGIPHSGAVNHVRVCGGSRPLASNLRPTDALSVVPGLAQGFGRVVRYPTNEASPLPS
jgi:hypothetical protein